MARRTRNNQSGRSTSEKDGGSMAGFAKSGKAANRQFEAKTPGQTERGFRQKTEREATAAMQGAKMPSTDPGNRWIKPARSDARRQFTKASGKAVF